MKSKQIAMTAILLAICIASQFLKNLSMFITGPIINAVIILAVAECGLVPGIIISIITPITSFFITGSPIVAAIPYIMPCIMLGNVILALAVGIFSKRENGLIVSKTMITPMIWGVIVKSIFMGVSISLILIPMFLPEKMQAKMAVFQTTFSFNQLYTGLIGCVLAMFIYKILLRLEINKA